MAHHMALISWLQLLFLTRIGVLTCTANVTWARVTYQPQSHGQVGDGSVEFVPTPAESRALVASAYRVPYTMLVQFENDAIDETPEMARILTSANPSGARSARSAHCACAPHHAGLGLLGQSFMLSASGWCGGSN